MKLNVKALGLAGGIVWGLAIFVLTYWFIIRGYEGSLLDNLSKVYLGYSVTWYGAFVGLIWGFADGFVGGVLLAWIYNKFAGQSSEQSAE